MNPNKNMKNSTQRIDMNFEKSEKPTNGPTIKYEKNVFRNTKQHKVHAFTLQF